MNGYLLDTDICIYFNKKLFGIGERMLRIGLNRCMVSEITKAELLFGAANSRDVNKNLEVVNLFLVDINVLPISDCLGTVAAEKARLRKAGLPLPDFDLLIGATAIHHNMTLVTNNTRHFERLQGIRLEDWTK